MLVRAQPMATAESAPAPPTPALAQVPAGWVLLSQGAEGRVYRLQLFARPAVCKERFRKMYRLPQLDETLTKRRLVQEVRCIVKSRACGVDAPCVYCIDRQKSRIFMEYIEGTTVKALLKHFEAAGAAAQPPFITSVMRLIGTSLAQLHDNSLVHGDLTTSNIMLRGMNADGSEMQQGRPGLTASRGGQDGQEVQGASTRARASDACAAQEVTASPRKHVTFIDFGLASSQPADEDKAVDIYVMERAFISTHPNSQPLIAQVLAAYREVSNPKLCAAVMRKLEEVRMRGRKRSMFG